MMLDNTWFVEKSYFEKFAMAWKVRKKLHSEQSKFQKIEVLQTESVGKLLLLDGKTMVSEIDEFVYHEVMAHIPYMVARKCEKVLIIGGGDGGVVREFVKHKDIKQIDLVEIDERVIEVSKEFFPECTQGLDDPRVNILAEDGIAFIKSKTNEYDVIIIDSTDPEDFASGLFTSEFYKNVSNALTEEGIMMNQTENPFLDEWGVGKIYKNMRAQFPHVQSFTAPMLIYPGVFWTFGFSSKKYQGTQLNPDKIRHMQSLERSLKWYNTEWHKGAFALSNFHKKKIGL
ncbi:MAG: spermidine synthase [Halobacteriovoraceae bacterium]|nr:spermidine synthase [Halobacteriovoraceae bacterium]|tara:strand:+ start:3434 stop:4291 length:858 start_codon:yes stop_codon:yes gene_type:complete